MSKNLSIEKLYRLIGEHGFAVIREFYIDGRTRFIEAKVDVSQEPFLLVVPRKYKIRCSERGKLVELDVIEESVDISDTLSDSGSESSDASDDDYIDPEEADRIVEEANDSGHKERGNDSHRDNDISPPSPTRSDLSEPIFKEMTRSVKDIERSLARKKPRPGLSNLTKSFLKHLDRYKPCVETLPYNLAILSPDGVFILQQDGSKSSYETLGKKRHYDDLLDQAKMLITVDLETFYSKMNMFEGELAQAVKGIQELNNQIRKKQLEHTMEQMDQIVQKFQAKTEVVEDQIKELQESEEKLKSMLIKVRKLKSDSSKKLSSISNREGADSLIASMYIDIDNSLEKGKVKKDVGKLDMLEDKICEQIQKVKTDINNLLLISDRFITTHSQLMLKLAINFQSFTDILEKREREK